MFVWTLRSLTFLALSLTICSSPAARAAAGGVSRGYALALIPGTNHVIPCGDGAHFWAWSERGGVRILDVWLMTELMLGSKVPEFYVRTVHVAATRNPTQEWTAQQLRNATMMGWHRGFWFATATKSSAPHSTGSPRARARG